MATIREIMEFLESKAPSATAESWDNVGLLAGDPQWEVKGAVASVDLTATAVQRAKEQGAGLIVTHHPCIFPRSKGWNQWVVRGPNQLQSLVLDCLQNRIAVAACHTNFDQCALEVGQQISKGLGIDQLKGRLHERKPGALTKLVVFVPKEHLESVRSVLAEAGAGHVGDYDACTFGTPGTGTFRGGENTNPAIGQKGRLETVEEIRLETVFPSGLKHQVLRALLASHPYEEVAYDFYSVLQDPAPKGLVKGLGYGFWGEFNSKLSFSELSSRVKRTFNLDGYWVSEPPVKEVRRLAFAAGKGSSFISAARSLGCDVLITGEVGYHGMLEASRSGMTVIELGHRDSEVFFPKVMAQWLSEKGLPTQELNDKTQKILF